MSLPRPELYTVDGLAEYWNVSSQLIQGYIHAGQLARIGKYEHIGGGYMLEGEHPDTPSQEELQNQGYSFKGWFIRLEEVVRFEQKYGVPGGGERLRDSETKGTLSRPRETEKPLSTMKAIAIYCGVHESTVKDWRKRHNDFPASQRGSGRVTALPSELNAWMVRKKKK